MVLSSDSDVIVRVQISQQLLSVRQIKMFSSLIDSKYSDQDQPVQLTLCYKDICRLSPLCSKYQKVKILNLNHCQIQSLDHVDQFQWLQELNIKYNNLGSTKELLKIKNKTLIRSLDFRGNDIEHYEVARIQHLKSHFPNLIELNGKDYRFVEISKIPTKKEVNPVQILHRLDTMGAMLQGINNPVQQDKQNSKPQVQTHRTTKESRPEEPTHKKKQLQISMGQIQKVNSQLCQQPTATFAIARQKEIEHKSSFVFKKEMTLSRIQKKSQYSLQASFTKYMSNNCSGLFPDLNNRVDQNKEDLVQALYSQNLMKKAFFKWSMLQESSRNMPRRKDF